MPAAAEPFKGEEMIDKIIGVFTAVVIITGIGIAVQPKSQAPAVIKQILSGFAGVQRAAYGNK
jgi:hypothetical protein